MTQLIVLSAIGKDRPGIVKDITHAVMNCGGNIEESRMTAVGTEFAVMLLISGNWHTLTKLEEALAHLAADGAMTINLQKTTARADTADCIPYGLDVICIDQPGIVFHLSEFFAAQNIEITDLATRRYAAAHTGAQMFSIQMTVSVPGTLPISQLRDDFMDLCERLNLDSVLEPLKG